MCLYGLPLDTCGSSELSHQSSLNSDWGAVGARIACEVFFVGAEIIVVKLQSVLTAANALFLIERGGSGFILFGAAKEN